MCCYIGPGATATTDSRQRLIGRLLRHGLELGVAIDEGHADDDEHENSWSSSVSDFKLSVGQSNAATPGRRPKATPSRLTAILESPCLRSQRTGESSSLCAAPVYRPAIEPGRGIWARHITAYTRRRACPSLHRVAHRDWRGRVDRSHEIHHALAYGRA